MVHKNYGGKANSLLFLQKHKFKIPPFFIIEEEQYIKFLKENDLFDQIKQLAQKKEFKEIQRKIQAAVISETLKKQIIKEFEKLNCTLVSVRSSALNEDGKTKSFAGQYNTFLNVSFEQLEEKIKLCWCSLYEENVLSYNEESNLYGMCVMIEKMIDPEYAGVVFSIDPTSDRKNYSIVEIVNGLGEKLVSGEETPTKLLVRRQTKQIDLQIGELRIDKKIIEQLEDIVLKIEELYQTNIDIEYAIKKKQIYILQARPITSLSIIPKLYRQTISRPYSLIELELYLKGEYEGIKKLTNEFILF